MMQMLTIIALKCYHYKKKKLKLIKNKFPKKMKMMLYNKIKKIFK